MVRTKRESMPKHYRHLTHPDRCQIYALKKSGHHFSGPWTIDQRPPIVEQKQRLGDWELDTIIGAKHQGAIVSAVDSASKFCVLARVQAKTADCVNVALADRLGPYEDQVITLTADNGKEFAGHSQIAATLKADVSFAKPYQSWQRGLNEHTNGLVHQYLPKSSCLKTVTDQEVDRIQTLLGNRPRKVLNYQTPNEVFFKRTASPPSGALHP